MFAALYRKKVECRSSMNFLEKNLYPVIHVLHVCLCLDLHSQGSAGEFLLMGISIDVSTVAPDNLSNAAANKPQPVDSRYVVKEFYDVFKPMTQCCVLHL